MKNEQKNAQDPVPENPRMPLTRRNYVLLAIGFAVVLLGFVLMAGGQPCHTKPNRGDG